MELIREVETINNKKSIKLTKEELDKLLNNDNFLPLGEGGRALSIPLTQLQKNGISFDDYLIGCLLYNDDDGNYRLYINEMFYY